MKEDLLEKLRKEASLYTDYQLRAEFDLKENNADKKVILSVQAELGRINRLSKELYENIIFGKIVDSEYTEKKQAYDNKIKALTEQEKNMQSNLRIQNFENIQRSKAAEDYQSVKGANDINADMVEKLIEKILVFEDKRISVFFRNKDATGLVENAKNAFTAHPCDWGCANYE